MKERGMLFSPPMVRALLDGSKTQTRRILKDTGLYAIDASIHGMEVATRELDRLAMNSPYGQPGDRLWVRETWGNVAFSLDESGERQTWSPDRPATAIHEMPYGNGYYSGHVIYRADGEFEWCDDDGDGEKSCWHPSIHMPREASRIDLEITGVRVDRLQDISEADAIAEGVRGLERYLAGGTDSEDPDSGLEAGMILDPRFAYQMLWESINGPGAWDANPWVWVIEFRRVKP
jgi:hypothetical protein